MLYEMVEYVLKRIENIHLEYNHRSQSEARIDVITPDK
jgi:hypothetical protein